MTCKKCGACCIFYKISVPDLNNPPLVALRDSDFPQKVWKEAGVRCQYLSRNSEGFYCSIHDSPNRPDACIRFDCSYTSKKEKQTLEECAKLLTFE